MRQEVSPLPRGLQATESTEAVDRHLPGEEGTWVFIFGGLLEFTLYFAAYLHSRANDPRLFAESQNALDRNLGAVNTLLLLFASLLVATAVDAVRRRERQLARGLLAGALVCGVIFSVVKLIEYQHHFAGGISWSTNGFFQYYFLLTGLHWFHLAFGICLLIVALVLAGKDDMPPRRLAYIEGAACFWHAVDVLWIVLFALLYLVRSDRDNRMTFLRTKVPAVWAALVMATLVSWWSGSNGFESNGDHRLVGTAVILIAFGKARLIGLYFMEIRQAPAILRVLFEGYIIMATSLVIGMYLAA